MTPNEIGTILDPVARAKRAQEWLADTGRLIEVVRDMRDEAIVQMRIEGMSQRRIAAEIDMSPGRVAQIDTERGVRSERVATLT